MEMVRVNKEIDTLLFDFDGTLMDTTNVIVQSWQQVYRKVTGKEARLETILATFGSILEDGLAEAFPGEPVDDLLKVYRGYHHDHFLELIELYPGIEEMLTGLKDTGLNMALVTSRLKKTTMQAVSEFRLDRFFDVIITADDCAKHKPDPEPILVSLEKLGEGTAEQRRRFDRETVMMIGDTIYDRECARNAGVKCALVSWAPSIDVHDLRGSDRPEFIIEKPADIFGIIQEQSSGDSQEC